MTEVVQPSDYEVVIDGQSYSANAVPAADSGVVIAARDRLLKDLKVESLISNLLRAGELLDLAYNGAAGLGNQRNAVTSISDQLFVLTGDCELTMVRLDRSSRGTAGNLRDCFKFLMHGREEAAIQWLGKAGVAAHGMADEADALPDRFETLGNDAVQTLVDTQKAQGKTEELVTPYGHALEGVCVQKEELQRTLRPNALFWRQMIDYSLELAESDLDEKIEIYKTFDDRTTYYRDPGFKEEFVRYMAGWKAIEVIAVSYSQAGVAADLRGKLAVARLGE